MPKKTIDTGLVAGMIAKLLAEARKYPDPVLWVENPPAKVPLEVDDTYTYTFLVKFLSGRKFKITVEQADADTAD